MVNLRQPGDVAQILLSVLFLAIMIIACLWIVRPFVLGFARAATVVVATAFTLAFAETAVWSPRPGRAGDDVAVVPAVYYSHCTTG